ncbi:MAG TPA: hypothetical protein VFP54_12670 [Acidimicrobiales bacterium]|nr:hypothetical protein [Acidimicrobiales bacterium]
MGQFHPLAQRASEQLAGLPSVYVETWPDQVIDRLGHDPHDSYCERFWLPVVGPSVYLLGRRFADWLDANPDGLTVPLGPLSAAIGLGQGTGRSSPLIRSLARMVAFGLARIDPGDRLAVRRRWPPLTVARASRLPVWLAQDHDAAIRASTSAARLDAVG